MREYCASCGCGMKIRIVLEDSLPGKIYCARCNKLIFPQDTLVSRQPSRENPSASPSPPAKGKASDSKSSLERIDNYRLVKKIGAGGMGTVYLAVDVITQEKAVIKALNMDFEEELQKTALEYFIREAQILADLNHPNIVKFKGGGNVGGRPYLAMEYIEGEDLREILSRGEMKVSQAIFILFHLAGALDYAYNLTSESGEPMRLIHRDIKPSNIILAEKEKHIPKLIDFGLAKSLAQHQGFTQDGTALGSPYYMPKEQILDAGDADHRSDIYSLGATFYHMLAGKPPFSEFAEKGNVDVMEAIVKHRLTPVRRYRANLPERLCEMVDRMMAVDRKDRYPSASLLRQEVKQFIDSLKKK